MIICFPLVQKSVESKLSNNEHNSTASLLRMLIAQADETKQKSIKMQQDIKHLRQEIEHGKIPVLKAKRTARKRTAAKEPLGRIRAISVISSALVSSLLKLVKKIWSVGNRTTQMKKPVVQPLVSTPPSAGETSILRRLVMNVVALMLTMSLLGNFVKADEFEEVGGYVKNYAALLCTPTPPSWDKDERDDSYASGPD